MRLLVLVFLLSLSSTGPVQAQPVMLTHVHGPAYSPDGEQLMIPSHHGLSVHENGKWSKPPGPQHDYMGFAATAKHLYSSGHPAPGSGTRDRAGNRSPIGAAANEPRFRFAASL